jgi:hypothetical protein
MEPIYPGLTEEQRDKAQAYAASLGLAFETGADEEEGQYYLSPLPGDEGAPQWDGPALRGLEEVLGFGA